MASYPPGQCCIQGVRHEGQPAGKMEKIGGVSSYVTYPGDRSTRNAVLLLTDVFGHASINPQLIADQLAANGYLVVAPDLFDGDPAPADLEGFDLQAWRAKHPPAAVDPIVAAVLKEMRGGSSSSSSSSLLQCERVGGLGYCFGAKYVVRNLRGGLIDAGFVAHPSFVDVDELRAVTRPLSIAAAEDDCIFPTGKRRESEDVLAGVRATYQSALYSGTAHGFATRGDLSKRDVKFAKEQAFLQAVRWFDEHVKA